MPNTKNIRNNISKNNKQLIQEDNSSSCSISDNIPNSIIDDTQKLIISSPSNRKFIIIPSTLATTNNVSNSSSGTSSGLSLSTSATPHTMNTINLITPTTTSAKQNSSSSVSSLMTTNTITMSKPVRSNGDNESNKLITQSDAIHHHGNKIDDSSSVALMTTTTTIQPSITITTTPTPLMEKTTTTTNTYIPQITTTATASKLPSSSMLGVNLRPKLHGSARSVVSAHIPSNVMGPSPSASLTAPNSGRIIRTSSYIFGDTSNRIFSDATSIRSLASIGVGSTDGRKLVIRRVPNSPTELLSVVSPSISPPLVDQDDDDDSYGDSSDTGSTHLKPRRQHWANKMQFVLACIAYSVGLGNVWRFPYLCYKSGGGVFLIPYFIILFVCSVPMLFMELSIGQYTGRGPIAALGQICPLFKGAGLASVIISFLMSTYYSVIIAYTIYYLFTSFKPIMPWTDCNNRWNTPDCWVPQRKIANMTPPEISRTPSEEFFENKVLQISFGIEYPGHMRWELFACLIFAWLLVYFATWKSIKSSAKVRYFTATFPFILIIVFMGRALTLEGADDGLRYFFHPRWNLLKNANVWINAASQNFNSLGIAFGSMISFASYNKYNNNIMHDTLAVSIVNAITSILVGIFAFATLGNLALEQNTNVEDVIGDGPGLIFVVYPQAMAKMPAGQMWAVMFFFMLLCLGLNSQFAIVEVVVTSIQDGFPHWIKRKLICHELLVLIICVVSFLLGLPNLVQSGIYYFQLLDHYAASISIMFLAFFQMIAISWFYGVDRLAKNIKQMTERAPSFYLRSCWMFCGPLLLISLWIFSLINYHEPTFHNGKYTYPNWAYGIGWTIASMSLMCIPAYAIINFLRAEGDNFFDKLKNTVKPNIYECKICGEHHCEHDFPDEQYMLSSQEMTPIIQPKIILKTPPFGNQQQQQQQQQQQSPLAEKNTIFTDAASSKVNNEKK